MNLIDTHSHIFPSYDGPESPLEVYHEQAHKIGVTAALVAPGPSPFRNADGATIYPAMWDWDDGRIAYYQWNVIGQEQHNTPAPANPYEPTNTLLFDTLRKKNTEQDDITYYAKPLIHPKLDTPEYVEGLLQEPLTAALKLHGIATFCGPADIPEWLISKLQAHGKPLVVHTDCFEDTPVTPIEHAYALNDPLDWVKFALSTGVGLVALHAACLSSEALALARPHPNIKFGIAPDLLMESEPKRLKIPSRHLIKDLFAIATPDQLLFDIDYSWNTSSRGDWHELDWNIQTRIKNEAQAKGWTDTDLEAIFHTNAERFFSL